MASRRMFSKKVINSARFLKMPLDSQLLYFHLGLNADDDGVVEAYTVMKTTGISDDNLKVLAAKELILVLNEDLVAYILDWHENNQIRADRKVNSIYKPLLIKMLPEADLIQPKPRSDVRDNSRRIEVPKEVPKEIPTEVPFDFKTKTDLMFNSKDRRMHIIAVYWAYKGIKFENKEAYSAGIKRELTPSGKLLGYDLDRIRKIMYFLNGQSNWMDWTLETVHKYIDKDLNKLEQQYASRD